MTNFGLDKSEQNTIQCCILVRLFALQWLVRSGGLEDWVFDESENGKNLPRRHRDTEAKLWKPAPNWDDLG